MTQTTFTIWYMRPEWFRAGICGVRPDPEKLEATHTPLVDLVMEGGPEQLEKVYSWMQDINWSPNGEARSLIEEKGLHHTSMCVGDVVVVDGITWVVATFGFDKL